VNTPACYKCHCKSSGLVYINGRHLCSVCLTAIVNAHAALKTRCQQAEKERDALNDQAADNAEGVCYETLHGLSTRSVDFGDPWRVEGVPQNVDDDLADMDTIGTVEYWEDSDDRSVGIPNTNGLSFKPAEGVCLITRDSLLTISQERDDLRDALRELAEQAKSALDIYDKEIMVTTLKAVIAAAEKVQP